MKAVAIVGGAGALLAVTSLTLYAALHDDGPGLLTVCDWDTVAELQGPLFGNGQDASESMPGFQVVELSDERQAEVDAALEDIYQDLEEGLGVEIPRPARGEGLADTLDDCIDGKTLDREYR